MPDRERTRVPDDRSDVLKGFLPQSSPAHPRYTGRSEAERSEEEIKVERKSGRKSVSASLSKMREYRKRYTRHQTACNHLNRNYKISLRSVLEDSILEQSTSQACPSNPSCFQATHRPWQTPVGSIRWLSLPVFIGRLLVSFRSSSPPQVCWLTGESQKEILFCRKKK